MRKRPVVAAVGKVLLGLVDNPPLCLTKADCITGFQRRIPWRTRLSGIDANYEMNGVIEWQYSWFFEESLRNATCNEGR